MKNPFIKKRISKLDRLGIKEIKREVREICIVRKDNVNTPDEWCNAEHYLPVEDLLKDENVLLVKERSHIETKYRRKTHEELLDELHNK